jgi:antitoxin CptB
MTEDRETRLKRLHMRSIRRGIKEMDLILTAFSERGLAALSATELDLYEQLLAENDQDLYAWVTEQSVPPEVYQNLIKNIRQLFNIK